MSTSAAMMNRRVGVKPLKSRQIYGRCYRDIDDAFAKWKSKRSVECLPLALTRAPQPETQTPKTETISA